MRNISQIDLPLHCLHLLMFYHVRQQAVKNRMVRLESWSLDGLVEVVKWNHHLDEIVHQPTEI